MYACALEISIWNWPEPVVFGRPDRPNANRPYFVYCMANKSYHNFFRVWQYHLNRSTFLKQPYTREIRKSRLTSQYKQFWLLRRLLRMHALSWVRKKKINQSDSEPLHNRVVASILYHIHSSSQFIYEFISCTLTHTLSNSTGLSELTIDLPTLSGFKAWWLKHLQRSWVRFLLRSDWFFPGKYLQLFKLQWNCKDLISHPLASLSFLLFLWCLASI